MKASEAVRLISNDEVVGFCGAGGGITEPTKVIEALAQRFKGEQLPKNLTLIHTTGLGDRNDRGMSPLAQQGMVKRVIGGSPLDWRKWQNAMKSRHIIFHKGSYAI